MGEIMDIVATGSWGLSLSFPVSVLIRWAEQLHRSFYSPKKASYKWRLVPTVWWRTAAAWDPDAHRPSQTLADEWLWGLTVNDTIDKNHISLCHNVHIGVIRDRLHLIQEQLQAQIMSGWGQNQSLVREHRLMRPSATCEMSTKCF